MQLLKSWDSSKGLPLPTAHCLRVLIVICQRMTPWQCCIFSTILYCTVLSLAGLLLENEVKVRPLLAGYLHDVAQEFSQKTLLMPLFRAYKKKKGDLQDTLLTMRLVISDCYDTM